MNLEPPRFINGKPMLIAGLGEYYPCDQPNTIPALWGRFAPHIGSIPGQIGAIGYGVCHEMDKAGFRYLAGVEVASADKLPDGFATLQIPAQRYAIFAHHGHVSKLVETAGAIWGQWLPSSGESVTDAPVMIERYGEKFDPQAGAGDIEIWLSIK